MPTTEEIKRARVQLGMTQVEAARLLEVSLRTYEGYEAGRKMPKPTWEIYQLHANIHPKYRLVRRKKRI